MAVAPPATYAPDGGPPAGHLLASPRARRLAAEFGIDIARVESAGGRIVEADVRRYLEQLGTPRESTPKTVPNKPAEALPTARRLTAERMTLSFQTVPHFYLTVLADATALAKLRDDLLPVVEQETGARLSYTDLLVKALGLALKKHADIHVSWSQDGIIRHQAVHIGIAAQFGDRLLVPVIRNADLLSVAALAKTRHELVARGRAGKLNPTDAAMQAQIKSLERQVEAVKPARKKVAKAKAVKAK